MDPLLTAGLFAGGSALLKAIGGLFGGKEEAGYEMSPEEKRVLAYLQQELQAPTPSWIKEEISPQFDIMRNLTRQTMTQQGMGQSGNLISALMNVEARRGREIGIQTGQYRQNIMQQIASLVSGKGTRWGKQAGGGVGGFLGELAGGGEDIGTLLFLKELGLFGGG